MPNENRPIPPINSVQGAEALAQQAQRLPERLAALQGRRLYGALAFLFLLALLFRFFDTISRVMLIAFVGAIVAMGLHFIVVRIPLRRGIATGLVALAILTILGLAVWQGTALLLPQLRSLASDLPALQSTVQGWERSLQQETGMEIDLIGGPLEMVLENPLGTTMGLLAQVFGVIEILGIAFLVLFGAIFVVAKPNEQLLNPILRTIPPAQQPAFRRVMTRSAGRLVGWLRGTLLSMLIIGALSALAFWLVGAPYALLLGVFVGIVEIIPVVGPWIGGAVAVLVTLLYDPQAALYVAIAVLVIQQVEGNLVRPFVMSGAAELHPFVTLLALLFFGTIFGFLGALLALPITLVIATFVEVFWVEETLGNREAEIEPLVET